MEFVFWLSALGLALSLPAAIAILLASRKPGGRRPYLALVFAEAGLYFLAELLSALLGRNALSLAMNYGSVLYGLPALYLYAREALGEGSERPLRHFIPALALLPVGVGLALVVASRGWRGGSAALAYVVIVLSAQTAQLVGYGRASLALAPRGDGPTGSEWPRRAVMAALAGYGAFLALSWLGLGATVAREFLGWETAPLSALDRPSILVAVLLAWTLGLCALWGSGASAGAAGGKKGSAASGAPKYGGRPLSETEATRILGRLEALLRNEENLASPQVAPRALAERLGLPYYLLSRAVNERGGETFSELLNRHRVERAKGLLLERPDLGILEVALEAGFQSKSTFNDLFRRSTGLSPSAWRESRCREGAS